MPLCNNSFVVYILECSDLTLYTGITNDISRRVIEHNTSLKGAKYTQGRRPVKLLYSEEGYTKSEALKRERRLKALSRQQKLQIILSSVPENKG